MSDDTLSKADQAILDDAFDKAVRACKLDSNDFSGIIRYFWHVRGAVDADKLAGLSLAFDHESRVAARLLGERNDARGKLAEALAREAIYRQALQPFSEDWSRHPIHASHFAHAKNVLTFEKSPAAALLLAILKEASCVAHYQNDRLASAVDAALANPTCRMALEAKASQEP